MNHGEGPPQRPAEWAPPPGPPPRTTTGPVVPAQRPPAYPERQPVYPPGPPGPSAYPPGPPQQPAPPQPAPGPPPQYPQAPYPAGPQPYPYAPIPTQYPGYPPGLFPYPSPVQPRRRRPRWPIWVSLGVVVVLLFCVAPAVFVASRLPIDRDRPASANSSPGASSSRAPSPGPNAPLRDRVSWVRGEITAALAAQTAALLRGDRKGFLAVADARSRKLVGDLEMRFGSLRALKVTQFHQRVDSVPTKLNGSGGRREWRTQIRIQHCFVTKDCRPDPVVLDSRWAETPSGVRMTSQGSTAKSDNGPRPWEVSNLRVAIGERAIVATTSGYASRLPALLELTESAARNADKFVLGDRPDRYRVFVAGRSEWKRWYGGDLPSWSVGFATQISDSRMEVVLNLDEIDSDFVDEVLRHELGHVATLASYGGYEHGNFWLVEGVAEYIQENGRPIREYDGRLVVRRYLREGKWNGKVNVPAPRPSTPDWQVGARYGISYYAVRRMSQRFGYAKFNLFFSEVVRQGTSLDGASRSAFQVSWANVNADCARFVRSQAG